MQITQKSFWKKTNFEFGEEKLKHTIISGSKIVSFSVRYTEILTDPCEIRIRRRAFASLGICSAIIGFVHIAVQYSDTGNLIFSPWLAIGAFLVAVYFFTRTGYTILQTGRYDIIIIKDSKHDKVFNEIVNRKKKLLYSLYGEINYENDPTDEINKFIWLKNQGVIDETEFKEAVRKINEYHEKRLMIAPSGGKDKKDILH